jgi:hypothetical protein
MERIAEPDSPPPTANLEGEPEVQDESAAEDIPKAEARSKAMVGERSHSGSDHEVAVEGPAEYVIEEGQAEGVRTYPRKFYIKLECQNPLCRRFYMIRYPHLVSPSPSPMLILLGRISLKTNTGRESGWLGSGARGEDGVRDLVV